MGQQNQKQQNSVEQDENSANEVQLTNSHRGRGRPLPLEMNCEIFKFLKWPNQRKLIVGMGRGIYGMFHQGLLGKTKRLYNSKGIRWNGAKSEAKISWDGLKASVSKCDWFPTLFYSTDWQYVFANKGFVVSEAYSGNDNFPGTIVYYFEVTHMATITSTIKQFTVGLSNGIIPAVHTWYIDIPDFYGFTIGNIYAYTNHFCYVSGNAHGFEWQAIKPVWKMGPGDVIGCGILLNPDKKLAVFFTGNGILMGKPIPINPSIDCLIPTACLLNCSVEANFGDNLVKNPFKFDINECPGLEFE